MKKFCLIMFLFLSALTISGFFVFNQKSTLAADSPALISDVRDSVNLPVLMYHGITDSPDRINEYNISTEMFESDLKWLGDNGFTSITANQLIKYASEGAALPSKPVLITFDDGYANNYSLAYPLLQKYHMKAVISVIGSQSDISSDDIYRDKFNSNLSWGEIAVMQSSGTIEIGNHTYNLHSTDNGRKGAMNKEGESFDDYARTLKEDLLKTQDKVSIATGSAPVVFAWPFGEYPRDRSADEILKEMGFKITLTSYQKMNKVRKGCPDDLFGLKRFLRTPDFDMNKKQT